MGDARCILKLLASLWCPGCLQDSSNLRGVLHGDLRGVLHGASSCAGHVDPESDHCGVADFLGARRYAAVNRQNEHLTVVLHFDTPNIDIHRRLEALESLSDFAKRLVRDLLPFRHTV